MADVYGKIDFTAIENRATVLKSGNVIMPLDDFLVLTTLLGEDAATERVKTVALTGDAFRRLFDAAEACRREKLKRLVEFMEAGNEVPMGSEAAPDPRGSVQ